MTPFLITGCGRSGTRYISELLTSNGISTGWESILTSDSESYLDYLKKLKELNLIGDASWYAVPSIYKLPMEVSILHQVRHPLNVIRSFLYIRLFGDDYICPEWMGRRDIHELVKSVIPEIIYLSTAIERCLYYWLQWNKLCEKFSGYRLYCRYRLEDVVRSNVQVLNLIWKSIAGTIPSEICHVGRCNAIFEEGQGKFLTWDMIPNSVIKTEAIDLAIKYGYRVQLSALGE